MSRRERSRKYRALRALRVVSQAGFFLLFLYLFIGARYTGEDYIGSTVQRFFHFDPLLGLVTIVAGRALVAAFAFSLITIAVTVVLGRVFCGWVCPLGSVHQAASWALKKLRILKPERDEKASLAPKYYVLTAVVAASVFGVALAGLLTPFSFLTRSFAVAVFPGIAYTLGALNGLFYGAGWMAGGRALNQLLTNWTLNATFGLGFAMGAIFLLALALNARKERFWCRYVCPTGAFLGLLARWNVLKVRIDPERCTKCGLCSQNCPTQARPYPNEQWKATECVGCQTCAAICPTAAVRLPFEAKPERIVPVTNVKMGRRRILTTAVLAVAAVPFFRLTPARKRAAMKLLRPPGSLPEEKFLARCVKCGQCMRACPTNGLQPALGEAGPEGLWTPVLVPKIGYCEYYCSLCTQVCPTGAIKKLTVEEKNKVKIGTAWVNKSRCIPYVLGRPCIVCEEHCPVSPKAIRLVMVETKLPDGTVVTQKAPVIDPATCTGCGICENKCPIMDEPGIVVTSVGETRSATNQLLLQTLGDAPANPGDSAAPADPYK